MSPFIYAHRLLSWSLMNTSSFSRQWWRPTCSGNTCSFIMTFFQIFIFWTRYSVFSKCPLVYPDDRAKLVQRSEVYFAKQSWPLVVNALRCSCVLKNSHEWVYIANQRMMYPFLIQCSSRKKNRLHVPRCEKCYCNEIRFCLYKSEQNRRSIFHFIPWHWRRSNMAQLRKTHSARDNVRTIFNRDFLRNFWLFHCKWNL